MTNLPLHHADLNGGHIYLTNSFDYQETWIDTSTEKMLSCSPTHLGH